MKYMANTAEELSTVSNVSVYLEILDKKVGAVLFASCKLLVNHYSRLFYLLVIKVVPIIKCNSAVFVDNFRTISANQTI